MAHGGWRQFPAGLAIDAGIDQAGRQGRAQQQVIRELKPSPTVDGWAFQVPRCGIAPNVDPTQEMIYSIDII